MVMDDKTATVQEQLYDIYDMWHVPWWQTRAFYVFLACLALLMVLVVVWYAVRAWRAKKRVCTPWDKALRSLDTLRTTGMATVVNSKEFYTALTTILKRYLYDRYGFDVQSKTDEEVIIFLEQASFPSELLTALRTIFNGSVIIKFANAQAIKEHIERDFAASRDIVYKTIPVKS